MHESSHQLAAIMFTDIVGYTSLMGSDEDRAFEILRKNQDIHKATISNFNGTLIKEIGDGMLISFPLASDAVKCALEIQKRCNDQNIPLKIGIHEGEMVFAGEDVYGDGVNIASRLQEVVNEGCIAISEKVYSDIKNKPGINTKLIGVKKLKNVDDPVKVYEVLCEEGIKKEPKLSKIEDSQKSNNKLTYYIMGGLAIVITGILIWYNLPTQPIVELEKSIAVRPFWNESTDQENEYFVNGMTEDIRNSLAKISNLRVISRGSMEKYRKTNLSTAQIAKELDVGYILEGTVQKLGNQIKIHVQLIQATDDDHIWEDTFIEDISKVEEVFILQSEIAKSIAAQIGAKISPSEKNRMKDIPTESIEAYNLYLQGRYFWTFEGKDNLDKSIEYYQRALDIDNEFALAYVGLAITYSSYAWFGYSLRKEAIPQAKKAAMKALEIDNTLGEAHTELAFALFVYDWDWSGSEEEFKHAIELNPNYARAHNLYAWLLTYIGRHDEAIEHSKRAHELDPLSIDIWVELGRHYYFARDYDKAIEEHRKVLEVFPNKKYSSVSWYARSELAKALSMKGLYDEAIKEYLKSEFEPTWQYHLGYIYGVAGKREQAEEILKYYLEQLKEEFVWQSGIAYVYIGLGEKEKALKWLENTNEKRDAFLLHLKVDPMFDSLRSDSRFQNLLERMNFPD